jgi:ribosome-binding ATPase YchF (GTP1/OBG family)
VRFFEDTNIHHVEGGPNPARDMETIKTELILADLATLKKRLEVMYGKSTVFLGYKKGIELINVLSICDVFVFPSPLCVSVLIASLQARH